MQRITLTPTLIIHTASSRSIGIPMPMINMQPIRTSIHLVPNINHDISEKPAELCDDNGTTKPRTALTPPRKVWEFCLWNFSGTKGERIKAVQQTETFKNAKTLREQIFIMNSSLRKGDESDFTLREISEIFGLSNPASVDYQVQHFSTPQNRMVDQDYYLPK
jgi:hypothetical protein